MHPSTETIFLRAIEMPKRERATYLDDACGSDPKLRAAVEALLWADEHPGILTRSPVSPSVASAVAAAAESVDVGHGLEGPGSVIGLYKLLEELGEGGFGRVFLADQEQPVRRRVALKILKAGMDTRQIIGRFEAERQALALMDHPGIAKVFDAGTTSGGRPYFVMELVKGIPLTSYADRHNLSLRERLALFREVCLAVQHAHTKGIIHRDLKPSNILVVSGDSGPEPKVIDFGIAKATGAQLSDKTVHTQAAQWLGTPEYMSPEQAGGGQDIDTRSDVYSLGAALYELLVGVTPFDTLRLRSVSYDQVARMIREDEPPRPSTRLSRLGDDATPMAQKRATDVARLAGTLKGDLDWIVMRAIDKDPSRRYDTAAALAGDIQRYLDNRPVEARPPSAPYQLSKWVRRNRGAFAATCAIGAAVVVGIVGLGVGLVRAADEARRAERSAAEARDSARVASESQQRAEREAEAARTAEAAARRAEGEARRAERDAVAAREEALHSAERERQAAELAQRTLEVVERQRRRAEAVERFIQVDMLGSGSSDEPLSPDYTVRRMVENAEARLDQGPGALPPDLEAAVRHTIGLLFIRVGDYQRAERNLSRAIALMEEFGKERDQANFADVLDAMGVVLSYLSRVDESVPFHERALALRREHEPDNPDSIASSLSNLAGAAADRGDLAEAQRLFEQALALRLSQSPVPMSEVGHVKLNLGMVHSERRDFERAERMLRDGLADVIGAAGERSAMAGQGYSLLGEMLIDAGRAVEAVAPLREGVQIRTEVFGARHRFTISSRTLLGRARSVEDPAGAVEELLDASRIARETLPIEDVYRLNAEQRLSMLLYQQQRHAEAEEWMRDLLPIMRYHFPPRDRALGGFLSAYGDTLVAIGGQERLEEAERILRECLSIREGAYGASDPNRWLIEDTRAVLADVVFRRAEIEPETADAIARFEEASALFTAALERLDPPARSRARLARALERAITMYEAWDAISPGQGIAQRAVGYRERLETERR